MKKLDSSEIDKIAGGQGFEIKKNGDHYDVLMSVGSFESEEQAKDFLDEKAKGGIVSGLFNKQLKEALTGSN